MNVYDFDETIYNGDSTRDFYLYCLRKKPAVLFSLPYQGFSFFLYAIGIIGKTQFKQRFYSFFKRLGDIDALIAAFWEEKEKNLKAWYLEQKRDSDVIISASPEFLLAPICKKLNVRLIASLVDKKSGAYTGENCYGREKVLRFRAEFPHESIGEFYSDSLSDTPLAELAEAAFVVEGDKITKWQSYKGKAAKAFAGKQFVSFVFVGVVNTLNGTLFSFLLSLFLDVNIAFVLGYIIALTIGYLLNTRLVFKQPVALGRYIKYAVSYIPNFIIQNICVAVFFNALGLYKLFAYLLAAVIGMPVTFVILKVFAFRKNM